MKDTSYNLEDPEDLYNFSRDCEEACCNCPQYNPWNPIDFDEDRNEVSPTEIFIFWKVGVGGNTLFKYDYYNNLSEDAKNTFRQYVFTESFDGIERSVTNIHTGKKLSDKSIQILTFYKRKNKETAIT